MSYSEHSPRIFQIDSSCSLISLNCFLWKNDTTKNPTPGGHHLNSIWWYSACLPKSPDTWKPKNWVKRRQFWRCMLSYLLKQCSPNQKMLFEWKLKVQLKGIPPNNQPLEFPFTLYIPSLHQLPKIGDFISDAPQLLLSEVKISPIYPVRASHHGCTFISCCSTIRDFRPGSCSETYATTSAHCSSSWLVSDCWEIPP